MFTLTQISDAHARVRSGADFPRYVQDIVALGVTGYDTFVSDGHSAYRGNPDILVSPPKYATITISKTGNKDQFIERLKLHQSGGTNYMTFCADCANNGIEKWTLDMQTGTCTYYTLDGESVWIEHFS